MLAQYSNTQNFFDFYGMDVIQQFMDAKTFSNLFLLSAETASYRLLIKYIERIMEREIPSCDNQKRRYIKVLFNSFKQKLSSMLNKLCSEEADYYLKKYKYIETYLKITKNGIKDPYGQCHFEYKQKNVPVRKQWVFEGTSQLAAALTFCQPFREPSISYSWAGTGILRFTVDLNDLCAEAVKLIEEGNCMIKAGLFYFLRPDCKLIHSNISFEIKSMSEISLCKETKKLLEKDNGENFGYETPIKYQQVIFEVHPLTLATTPKSFIIDIELTTKPIKDMGIMETVTGIQGMRISGVFLRVITY